MNGHISNKTCLHTNLICINHYELIRKYRCTLCNEVMMCACEENFARRFLPHQLSHATDLFTKDEIPVTIGFQKNICNKCRGVPEEAHPKAKIRGADAKFERYYWRELAFETIERFGNWLDSQGIDNWLQARSQYKSKYDEVEREVKNEIRELDQQAPKYAYIEESQESVLSQHKVEIVRVDALYRKQTTGPVSIQDGNQFYAAEEFASRYLERQGYSVVFTESVPFHVLFGIYMWLLIQSPNDSRLKLISFGERTAYEEKAKGETISTLKSDDFGSLAYAQRRAIEIENHFKLLPKNRADMLWAFDHWVEPSAGLRQYLWAHRPKDVAKARELVSILPVDTIHIILRYLIENYGERFLGWPDLVAYKDDQFFFAEVKASKDKLDENQKNWIRNNSKYLHLPFRLIKIHRIGVVEE